MYRRRRRTFFYVRNKGNLVLLVTLTSIVLLCFSLLAAELKLRPLVRDMALSRAKLIATRAINDAINKEMQDHGDEYGNVVDLQKDAEGKIIALELDITKINKLKAAVVSGVTENLQKVETSEIKIPIGNIINGEIFSGRGPKISIKLLPVASVNAYFASEFTSAGINQTRHRVLINTDVYVSVMLPAGPAGVEVTSEVSISETLLIGNVPESYTYIEDNQSELLEKINNYIDH